MVHLRDVNELIEQLGDQKENVSDGYHSFSELYDHRSVLYISLCYFVSLYTDKVVWKSKVHNDGTSYPGWFIMGIETTKGEQIRYHLPDKYWNDTSGVSELKNAPEWDGHTSTDVLNRLKELL